MRKFITGLLAAGCIAAVLTGCSSSGGAKETSAPETSAAAAKETESEPAKEAVSATVAETESADKAGLLLADVEKTGKKHTSRGARPWTGCISAATRWMNTNWFRTCPWPRNRWCL